MELPTVLGADADRHALGKHAEEFGFTAFYYDEGKHPPLLVPTSGIRQGHQVTVRGPFVYTVITMRLADPSSVDVALNLLHSFSNMGFTDPQMMMGPDHEKIDLPAVGQVMYHAWYMRITEELRAANDLHLLRNKRLELELMSGAEATLKAFSRKLERERVQTPESAGFGKRIEKAGPLGGFGGR